MHTHDWLVMRADAAPEEAERLFAQAWPASLPLPGKVPAESAAPGLVPRPVASPDLWNTKPPLLPWLQATCLRWLGYSNWAVRLPAALAGWLMVVQLYLFGWRVQQQPRLGLAAALVLATTPAYVGFHVVRTGDADALLVLFVTAYLLSFWTFLQRQQRCFLAGASVGLALALLAKCSAAALPLPGLLAYVLLVPRHRWVSRNKLVTGAFLLAFGPLLLYYGLREAAASGYLVAAWHNDWFKLPVTPLC